MEYAVFTMSNGDDIEAVFTDEDSLTDAVCFINRGKNISVMSGDVWTYIAASHVCSIAHGISGLENFHTIGEIW